MRLLRTAAIALLLPFSTGAAFAQSASNPPGQPPSKAERVQKAKERCKQNRGVDCESPEGLKEWLLQDRSREEAVREGSRHIPAQQQPARR